MKDKNKLQVWVDGRNGHMEIFPCKQATQELVAWKSEATGNSIAHYVREVLGPKCSERDLPLGYRSVEQIARAEDRDVQGYVDKTFRDSIRIRISDFLSLSVERQDEYLKWARENVSLQVTGIINALLAINGGKIDLTAPEGLVAAIKRNQCEK